MKLNTDIRFRSRHRRENQSQILQVHLFDSISRDTNLNSFALKLCNLYSTERNSKKCNKDIF